MNKFQLATSVTESHHSYTVCFHVYRYAKVTFLDYIIRSKFQISFKQSFYEFLGNYLEISRKSWICVTFI